MFAKYQIDPTAVFFLQYKEKKPSFKHNNL